MTQIDLPRSLVPALDVVVQQISLQLGNSSVKRSQAIHRSLQTFADTLPHIQASDWLEMAAWYRQERSDTDRIPFIADANDLERIRQIREYVQGQEAIHAIVHSDRGEEGMSRRMLCIFAVLMEAKKSGYVISVETPA